MKPRPSFNLVLVLALLVLSTGCRKETIESKLLVLCEGRSTEESKAECVRLARLRAAYIDANEDGRERRASNSEEEFRRVIHFASQPYTPKLVCKKNAAGGVYCMRTIDVFSAYKASALEVIAADLRAASAQLDELLSESGLLYCPNGSVETFSVAGLDPGAFTTAGRGRTGWAGTPAIRAASTMKPTDVVQQEEALLETLAESGCADDTSSGTPTGALPLPGSQRAFSECMVAGAGATADPLDQALQIAEDAMACVEPYLDGSSYSPDDPLAQAAEDLSTLMEGANAVDTSTAGSATVTQDSAGNTVISVTDSAGGVWTLAIGADGESYLVAPDGGTVSLGNASEGVDIGGESPFGLASGTGGSVQVAFDDASSVVVDPAANTVVRRGGSDGYSCGPVNPGAANECESLDLTPIPKRRKRRRPRRQCAPDDLACQCGTVVELAVETLGSCVAGTANCQKLASSFACCEAVYGDDPRARPNPIGDFVCEDAAQSAAATMLDCADRCSRFEWEGCMDWCLNGPTVQRLGAGWLDNICLYVSGLECPQIGPGVGIGPDPGAGLGLPRLPDEIADAVDFNLILSGPDQELFEDLLLGESPSERGTNPPD